VWVWVERRFARIRQGFERSARSRALGTRNPPAPSPIDRAPAL